MEGGGEAPASSPVARAGTCSPLPPAPPLRGKKKGRPKNNGIAAATAVAKAFCDGDEDEEEEEEEEEEEALVLALLPLAEMPKGRPDDLVDDETVR